MADLSPAEKAAQERWPKHLDDHPDVAYSAASVRAAYIRGDAAGYKRAIQACISIAEGWFNGKYTNAEAIAALRALAAGKE